MEQVSIQELSPNSTPAKPAIGTEFIVTRHDLLKELSELHKVVQRKATVPILANIMVQATGYVLALTATDLDLSLRTVCPARVKKEGRCAIAAQKLYDYMRFLEDGEIAIRTLENNWMQIRSGRSHTKMVGLSPDTFPKLPLFPAESAMKLEANVLSNLIAKIMFAISTEGSRYILNAALLLLKPQVITMVATDGHRLAYVECSRAQCADVARVIVPKKAVAQLNALLSSSNVDTVLFAENDSTIFFAVGSRLLTSRELVGKFPNYEAVLPKEPKSTAVVAADELLLAIQRVAQFSDERSNAVRIGLGKDEFKISSSSPEAGESEDVIETSYSGEPAVTAFNAQYLLEFLKVVGSIKVRFEFKDAQSASEFRPEDSSKDECSYRYEVMPATTCGRAFSR